MVVSIQIQIYWSYHTFMQNTHTYSYHYIFVLLFFHSYGWMIMLSRPKDPCPTFSPGVPKPKARKSTPTHGHRRGVGSLPKSPKPPPVGRSVTIHSGNENNTQSVPTPSGNENRVVSSNPLGKGVGVGLPLKDIPVQHINDSHPKPITDKQVKKKLKMVLEYNNLTFQLCRCQMLSLYALYAKSILENLNWLENIKT